MGIANLPVEVRPVNAVLGGSVLFPAAVSPTKTVAEIEWKLQLQGGLGLRIAEFSGGKFIRPNPGDRFGQRLEMADETTLKMKNLAKEDSGVYMARVTFTTFAVLETFFNLTVCRAANDPVRTPLRRVGGVLGRSVSLSVDNVLSSDKIGKVEWDFQPRNGTGLSIAEFRDGKWERPNPGDRFGPRLEPVDETTLRVRNLEKEDGGDYKARVRLHSAEIREHTFRLTIYDPVPEPQILLFLQETSDSSSKCNVTLRCSVSEKTGLNVSWRIGDALEPFDGGLDRRRFSSEGWHLHLPNLSSPMDSRVTCLVSNPADRKSASVRLTGACLRPDVRKRLWWLVFPVGIGIGIGIALVSSFWIWKRRRKRPRRGQADSASGGNKAPEVQYMEVPRAWIPSEKDKDQDLGRLSEPEYPATVYAKVQHPSLPPDQAI